MSVAAQPLPVEVTLRDNVGSFAGDYARRKVTAALSVARGPVLFVHVVLDHHHDPALHLRASAEVTAQVDGHVLRARTAAPTMREAVDALDERLRHRLVRLQGRERTRHRWSGVAGRHEWRHGDLPRLAVPYFPRPAETREVRKFKAFAGTPLTVAEATYQLELLDHDFFLFRDAATGGPALVHRQPEGGYAVRGGAPDAPVHHGPPPASLTDEQARARLEAEGAPYVFYVVPSTGEGRVLYHRYDGHYGLITLTDESSG